MSPDCALPQNYDLIYSPSDIASGVSRIGGEINSWALSMASATGADIYAVPVLRGGLFFFADLVRELRVSVEVAEVRAWAYLEACNEKQREKVEVQMERLELKGRGVLIVDDICDSGRTLATLSRQLISHGAREVRTVVLIRRDINDPGQFQPDWSCFEFAGREWLVGYGMDDRGAYRNLPAVYRIQGTGGGKA